GANKLKLAWGDDHWDPPTYSVSRKLVAGAAERVRSVLNDISDEYIRNTDADYTPFLADLVEAGVDLSSELFDAIDGDRQTASDAKAFIAGAAFITSLFSLASVTVVGSLRSTNPSFPKAASNAFVKPAMSSGPNQ